MTKMDTIDIAVDATAIDEMNRGMMFAELAITDNKENTLKKVSKNNPWHEQALKMITGSKKRAHLPLKEILYEDMDGLILDCEIDVSGITKGGHFLDTQGYVAHNDDYVVVAFRCTTSVFDWLTNFNTSSSAWEVEEDAAQGFSGFCSGLDGLCCQGGNYQKPRVHTGFYNNALAALPTIRKHVDQYLVNWERPRKLYIVGHSLGAGIANITATYFLLQYNWSMLPQSLVVVTAGSPRSICQSMKKVVDEKREEYGVNNVRFYRLVKGKDAVTTVPPKILGYEHMVEATVITDEGRIVLRLQQDGSESNVLDLMGMKKDKFSQRYLQQHQQQQQSSPKILDGLEEQNEDSTDDETDDDDDVELSEDEADRRYNNLVARIPKALRDHMPDFYMKPLFRAKGITRGTLRTIVEDSEEEDDSDVILEHKMQNKTMATSKNQRSRSPRKWIPTVFRRKQTSPVEAGPYF